MSEITNVVSDMKYWANHYENSERHGVATKVREWIIMLEVRAATESGCDGCAWNGGDFECSNCKRAPHIRDKYEPAVSGIKNEIKIKVVKNER